MSSYCVRKPHAGKLFQHAQRHEPHEAEQTNRWRLLVWRGHRALCLDDFPLSLFGRHRQKFPGGQVSAGSAVADGDELVSTDVELSRDPSEAVGDDPISDPCSPGVRDGFEHKVQSGVHLVTDVRSVRTRELEVTSPRQGQAELDIFEPSSRHLLETCVRETAVALGFANDAEIE